MSKELTFDYVQSRLALDRETGVLTWKERTIDMGASLSYVKRWNTRHCGKEFGSILRYGRTFYRKGAIDREKYFAHRIVWLLFYGDWPGGHIDHIDHDGLNNKPENLRVVTPSENHRNRRMDLRNKSGYTGVTWHASAGSWQAFINTGGGQRHLGLYDDIQDAVEARKLAEIQYGYHPNHGEL